MDSIFTRSKKNPILRPDKKSPWQSVMTYNPGVIYHNKKYHLIYRAVGQAWVSKLGYAVSDDGVNFSHAKHPLLEPKLDIEKNGLEDPRVVRIGTRFYLTYTAYDGQTARLCLATSPDLKNWRRLGEVFPDWDSQRAGEFAVPWDQAQHNQIAKKHWVKAGAIFPERVQGEYWMLFGDRFLWLASGRNPAHWVPEYEPFLLPRRGFFDSVHIEMGPPPVRTKQGWLVFYHGVDETITYRLGFLLLDLHNPKKIIKRTRHPIFEPQKTYEISGLVDILPGGFGAMETMGEKELKQYIAQTQEEKIMPRVIFCPGAVLRGNKLQIYYGAGDSCIGTATAKLADILAAK